MTTNGIKLIGAAFPRTGTMSVKRALESIGFGQCYHMHEVFLNPGHVPVWDAVCDGHMPDWSELLSGYTATLDTPACHYWEELAAAFPEAKIVLLRRDPDTWYESMYNTTYQVIMGPRGDVDPALQMIRRLFLGKHMKGRFEDRDFAVNAYRRYCENVPANVPSERLLVYEVSEGWQPLCDFLGLQVPDEPFPVKNTRDEFRARSNLT
jgi:hypothetical protein